ncbi:MAG TPA: hypothetical protein VMV23_12680, partial [Candidatus Nanopelagicaceae bacterium]|nr:hypothetical protein [Candidatus Nanopelagicaceae bacterium]
QVFALTHLAVLGWVTMMIMGALYQLFPVALQATISSPNVGRRNFWVYLARIHPSADRLVLIDDLGEPVSHEEATCLLALSSLRARPGGAVVGPVSSSRRLEQVVEQGGGRMVLARADSASIVRTAARTGALFAADEDAGFVWPEHLAAYDGMFTLLQLVQLLIGSGERLSELRRHLPMATHLEREVSCPWEVKGEVMRLLVDAHRGGRVDLTNGMKLEVDKGWVLVLPDAGRPQYRVIVSLEQEQGAAALLDRFVAEVEAMVSSAGGDPTPAARLYQELA